MPPPATPSDATTPSHSETAKVESTYNLLDIWGSVKKDALAPAGNSLIVEPVNVGANIVNGLSSAGNWCYDKATGKKTEAYQVGKITEFEVGDDTGVAKYSHRMFGMAGSFLAYAVAGKVAGGALRTVGEFMPLNAELANLQIGCLTRSAAQDARLANVLGATVYAGLKDPAQGESRRSNVMSTFVGFGVFELGNARLVSPGAPMAFKLGQRYLVGSYGGAFQAQTASLVHDHRLADPDQVGAAALGGGLLNALMPQGRRAVDAMTENPLIKGLPRVTDGVSRVHVEALSSLPEGLSPRRGSWADTRAVDLVNQSARADLHTKISFSDAGSTRIDQKRNVVYQRRSDSPLSLIQELAHRRIFRDPVFERDFRASAADIHSNDFTDPANRKAMDGYVRTRLNQEVEARGEQNEAARKLGVPERVSVDPNHIRDVEGYGLRFEKEAQDFIGSAGKTRPGVDHSTGVDNKGAADEITARAKSAAGNSAVSSVVTETAAARAEVTAPASAKTPDLAIVAGTDIGAGERNPVAKAGSDTPRQPADLNVVAGKDTLDPAKSWEIERARIERWASLSAEIKALNNAPTDGPQNKLLGVVRQRLNATGLGEKGWMILPTQSGSPLDQVGCDYAMVNARTHEVIFLDATQNPEKLANPSAKNVSRYRMEGLIGFDQHLIDEGGYLKIGDEPGTTEKALAFQDDLDHQLLSLAKNGSSITTEMLPSYLKPSSPSANQAQIEKFRQQLITRAGQLPVTSEDRYLLTEYAEDLKRGALRHNELMAATVESKPLADNIARVSDRVVLDYVLTKMRIKDAATLRVDNPDVKMRKDGHLVISREGTIYDGGNVQESIADARTRLRGDRQFLATMLQRDKAVLKKMTQAGWNIDAMVKKVQETLVESREVDNGLLGTTDLGLAAAVKNRIANGNMEEMVTGRRPEPPKAQEARVMKPPAEVAFTPEQQTEISNLVSSMAEFNLELRDGVDSKDMLAFLEMYRDESPSATARELCAQYLAEADKPASEQKFIPRFNGAIAAAQITLARANGVMLDAPIRTGLPPGSSGTGAETFDHR
jgi:hypothetical protein